MHVRLTAFEETWPRVQQQRPAAKGARTPLTVLEQRHRQGGAQVRHLLHRGRAGAHAGVDVVHGDGAHTAGGRGRQVRHLGPVALHAGAEEAGPAYMRVAHAGRGSLWNYQLLGDCHGLHKEAGLQAANKPITPRLPARCPTNARSSAPRASARPADVLDPEIPLCLLLPGVGTQHGVLWGWCAAAPCSLFLPPAATGAAAVAEAAAVQGAWGIARLSALAAALPGCSAHSFSLRQVPVLAGRERLGVL